jgi:hypothetical protein
MRYYPWNSANGKTTGTAAEAIIDLGYSQGFILSESITTVLPVSTLTAPRMKFL